MAFILGVFVSVSASGFISCLASDIQYIRVCVFNALKTKLNESTII